MNFSESVDDSRTHSQVSIMRGGERQSRSLLLGGGLLGWLLGGLLGDLLGGSLGSGFLCGGGSCTGHYSFVFLIINLLSKLPFKWFA